MDQDKDGYRRTLRQGQRRNVGRPKQSNSGDSSTLQNRPRLLPRNTRSKEKEMKPIVRFEMIDNLISGKLKCVKEGEFHLTLIYKIPKDEKGKFIQEVLYEWITEPEAKSAPESKDSSKENNDVGK
jgi:hypothetical protein